LRGRHDDFATGIFQQFQCSKADVGSNEVDEAGDEQTDFHGRAENVICAMLAQAGRLVRGVNPVPRSARPPMAWRVRLLPRQI